MAASNISLARLSLLLKGNEFKNIKNAAAKDKSVHAYIIQGQQGMGKRSLASLLCAALLCPSHDAPCLECSTCRRILSGEHPDVHFFKGAKKNISVDEMRKLSERSIESSYEGGKRVFIINDAHSMTVPAQNCLLKTLEEPSGSAVFVLLSSSGGLLPTVRSRCRAISLTERSVEQITDQLRLLGYSSEVSATAAKISGGNIGKAIEAANGSMAGANAAQDLLKAADRGNLYEISALLAKNKDNIVPILENTQSLLGLRLREDPSSLITLVRIREVNDALERIKRNINYGLLSDKLARGLTTGEITWQR
ncbi:MAG: hypothetical protein IKK58_02075 [Clostridia bacterium]|nr:hypothetical protein [Clostridia bacterium]